tara:strand:+ start:485 stop:1006 length:522 start_codon:yes stop_codon:yes gene_type:complete
MTDTTEQPTELQVLKERADDMGIKYSPNIGVKSLREKVNGILAPEPVAQAAAPSKTSKYNTLLAEATKLIRVRVTNLNPNKKHSEGEWFRTGNSVISTISRFVPFENDTHVENMLLSLIKSREYAVVQEKKNSDGKMVPVRSMRREFQIEVLASLSAEELEQLAADQSKRQSV